MQNKNGMPIFKGWLLSRVYDMYVFVYELGCMWSLQTTILYVDWLLIIPTDDITLAALGILPYFVPDVRYKADMSKIVYLAKVITYIIIRYLIG